MKTTIFLLAVGVGCALPVIALADVPRHGVPDRDAMFRNGKSPLAVPLPKDRPECGDWPPHITSVGARWVWARQHGLRCSVPSEDGPERQSRPEPKKPEPKKPEPPVCE